MEKEQIPISSDHKGFLLKAEIINYLKELGYDPLDFGAYSEERVDYPKYAGSVAEKIAMGRYRRGIVMCHTGVGASIVANKFPGVRAALVTNENVAKTTREHNDSNILALGAGHISVDDAKKFVKIWLDTKFEGGRHQKRVENIAEIEKYIADRFDDGEKMADVKISASLMCANQLHLLEEVNKLVNAGVDLLHIDIIDGRFAPNIAMSPYDVFAIRSHTNVPIDVHLMVDDPTPYIQRISAAGANIIVVHLESKNIESALDKIKESGARAGIAINAETSIEKVYPYIDKIEYLLFMCIRETGFEAKPFSPESIEKIRQFSEFALKNNKKINIMVDGSVGPRTITPLYRAGARIFVGGTSGIFKPGNYSDNIKQMRSYCY